ncbi:hypothetical protein NE619_00850 [Anaerovorax odorimutans]|uniref:Uncharacterized protein n=1 Tax=Anaerovorax odorimutans TaxID=109327 RepID=A0ABT1RJC3_9FIRM|nr:hypothetical protein [Anaerovorax odorimutans]MCQ4635279.1 hypothetical protein [Anaerovorax odorimutans]
MKHRRKTDAAGVFSFKNRCFQILDAGFPIINAHKEITVLVHPNRGIRMEYQGRTYDTIRYLKPQNKNTNTKVPRKVVTTVTPHVGLRHGSEEWKRIWWMEDYNLSLKFFYELFFEKQSKPASVVKGRKRPFTKKTVSQVNFPYKKGHFLKLLTPSAHL